MLVAPPKAAPSTDSRPRTDNLADNPGVEISRTGTGKRFPPHCFRRISGQGNLAVIVGSNPTLPPLYFLRLTIAGMPGGHAHRFRDPSR